LRELFKLQSLVSGSKFTKRGTSGNAPIPKNTYRTNCVGTVTSPNDMVATEANIEIKVTQLEMTMMTTNGVLEKGKHEAIERHLSTLEHLSSEVNRMRLD